MDGGRSELKGSTIGSIGGALKAGARPAAGDGGAEGVGGTGARWERAT